LILSSEEVSERVSTDNDDAAAAFVLFCIFDVDIVKKVEESELDKNDEIE
jgi:hypothetical protein